MKVHSTQSQACLASARRPGARACSLALLGASLALPLSVLAEGDWHGSVALISEYTNNANKSSTEDVSERQDEIRLGLGGDYTNSLLEFGADYRASERRFDKGSQQDRSLVEGDSRLLIGKPHHSADLLLSHSRRTVLNAPDDVELLRNSDEREILSAVPSVRWRPTGADALIARGTYAKVDYRLNPERNSERTGGDLVWERDLSATDQFSLTAQQMDIRFDAAPQSDYRYSAYFAAYRVQLRRLNYRVQLGFNESDPEVGESQSNPTYGLNVGFDTGLNQWELSASQFITDSSAGSGNQGELGGFNPGDSSGGEVDQLERSQVSFTWTTQSLCGRCTLSTTLYHQNDDYRLEDEDRSEQGVRLSHGYRLSEQASINARYDRRNYRFEREVARSDFRIDRAQLSYDYRFPRGLGASLFAGWEERESDDNSRDYDELSGGLSLHFTF